MNTKDRLYKYQSLDTVCFLNAFFPIQKESEAWTSEQGLEKVRIWNRGIHAPLPSAGFRNWGWGNTLNMTRSLNLSFLWNWVI